MPVSAGDKLGPYEILAPIGAGGMGEVWKARDTRLDRTVALKVVKQEFSQRFEREARTIASLNHPNICQLHDVGPCYLVMELVEGQAIKGPLPLNKAVAYAAQILEALDAAHKKGIIHRDLKPANILLTKQGVKLLDFGLAKTAGTGLKETDATITSALTSEGQILGTLQYMSPEQLQGKEADARSDLYAFGCVLYELLTGKRAFDGQSAASVIAAIMERDPPSIGNIAPPALDQVLRRTLAKDPDHRWQTARDLQSALELTAEPLPQPPAQPQRYSPVPWLLAAAGVIAGAFAWWSPGRDNSIPDQALAFHINPPPGQHFVQSYGGSSISPDGRNIAFIAASTGSSALWIRPLDSFTARQLPGTEEAQHPFWSPDGRSIGYFADGKLKRIDLSSGQSTVIADAPTNRGGAWSEQGAIVFSPNVVGGLMTVPAAGGTAVPFTNLDPLQDSNHRWPQFLSGGREILYLTVGRDPKYSGVYWAPVARPRDRKKIVDSFLSAYYVPPRLSYPGYLLWPRQGVVTAQPFDAKSGQLSGEPLALPEVEARTVVARNYSSGIEASRDGMLLVNNEEERFRLTWYSRDGKVLGTVSHPDGYAGVRISPDGTRAALSIAIASGDRDLWILDFARGIQTRLSSGYGAIAAIWSPDGKRILYFRPQGTTIFERDSNGVGQPTLVAQSSNQLYADDFTKDGRLLYEEAASDGSHSLWVMPNPPTPGPNHGAILYLTSSSTLSTAQFSPDDNWVSYTSNSSGRPEVYVHSFPKPDTRIQVSNGGGSFPRWRRDGKELFYRALDGHLMAATVGGSAGGLELGTPVQLGLTVVLVGERFYDYDVDPDGQRFFVLAPDTSQNIAQTILTNWQSRLRK